MKEKQDAFGQQYRDFLEGKNRWEAVERDDGYLDASTDLETYFAPYERWPLHQKKAMDFVRGRVLDIGCGAGRHALHLQNEGHEVTGIDTSPMAVEICGERGLKDVRLLSITRIGKALGSFDTILMLGNNFGLFGSFDRARRLLGRFRNLTTGRGRILAETLDPYDTEEPAHLAYHRKNRERGRMSGQIRLRLRHREHATPWFDYLFVSREELGKILQGTGWRIETILDSDGPVYLAVLAKE